MDSRPDLLWLHAGAVEKGDGVLLIGGMAAQGKSTIISHLLNRGWRLLSDDISPVHPDSLFVLPYYELPVRRSPRLVVNVDDRPQRLHLEDIPVLASQLQRDATVTKMIVFVSYDPAKDMIQRLDSGMTMLKLLENTANFGADAGHNPASLGTSSNVFRWSANLASSIPGFALGYSDSVKASNDLEALYHSTDLVRGV
jgi:hypothetical protein